MKLQLTRVTTEVGVLDVPDDEIPNSWDNVGWEKLYIEDEGKWKTHTEYGVQKYGDS